ncbi:MAG: hypothetical protein H0U57_12520 [Tatlockia sp.]|nr:hypothetical protein [Tatlockia sp.]
MIGTLIVAIIVFCINFVLIPWVWNFIYRVIDEKNKLLKKDIIRHKFISKRSVKANFGFLLIQLITISIVTLYVALPISLFDAPIINNKPLINYLILALFLAGALKSVYLISFLYSRQLQQNRTNISLVQKMIVYFFVGLIYLLITSICLLLLFLSTAIILVNISPVSPFQMLGTIFLNVIVTRLTLNLRFILGITKFSRIGYKT